MPVYGYKGQTGWGEETAWGTAVAINRAQEFLRESLKLDIGRLYSPGIRGSRQKTKPNYVPSVRNPNGEITFNMWNKGLGLWLKHSLGTVVTTQPDAAGNPTVFLHTFTPAETLPVGGLTVEKGLGTQFHKYAGVRVDQFSLRHVAGELPELVFATLSKDETVAATGATLTFPATPELLRFDQGVFLIGGVATTIYEATITVDNLLRDDDYRGGALTRFSLDPQGFQVSGTFRLPYDAVTEYTKFRDFTAAALNLKFTGSIISGTFPFFMEFDLPVVFYNGSTPEDEGMEEEIDLEIPFVGFKDAAAALTVKMQNNEAAAAL